MTGLLDLLATAAAVLARAGRDFALVGGLAVSARVEPRFTRDIDLAVAVRDDVDAEALVRHFTNAGFGIAALVEHETAKRLATVRLLPPGGHEEGAVVDLLFASSGIERDIIERAELVTVVPDLTVAVATVSDLLVLKLLARDDVRRPQDRVDALALAGRLDEEGFDHVRRALAAIEAAGYQRGRDLQASLRRIREEVAGL